MGSEVPANHVFARRVAPQERTLTLYQVFFTTQLTFAEATASSKIPEETPGVQTPCAVKGVTLS
jgi:hypothetical protein